ncbi:MAG: transglutaminase domain-containing protein [Bacteroidia bacterium]
MNRFKTILIVISLSICFGLKAQKYLKIDSAIKRYPKFSNTDKLAARINTDFNEPDEKARAIYAWISMNVKYDVELYYSGNRYKTFSYKTKEQLIEKEKKYFEKTATLTIKTKKGVCEEYSILFKKMCDLCGLESTIITGGVKTKPSQIGVGFSLNNHVWNAVKIDGIWKLIDATWGAGTVDEKEKLFIHKYDDTYFFANPERFSLNHYPKDTSWVLTKKSKEYFLKQPLYYNQTMAPEILILNPLTGLINTEIGDTINFKIVNIPESATLAYEFSTEKYSHPLKTKIIENNGLEFQIVNTTKFGYLTIYANNISVVTFKISD